jgi:hypothetical protein
MKILGREPTLWLALISSLLGIAGTVGLGFLDTFQATALVVAINAIFAAINAYAVRPISPVAFTYAVASVIAVLGAYGLNLPETTVAMVNATVIPFLALLSRGQVSPVETSVSTTTVDPVPEAAEANANADTDVVLDGDEFAGDDLDTP